MEAAVRAFEDWEFSVLERESGIEEEEDGATADEEHGIERKRDMEKEVFCQQHLVNSAQVNNMPLRYLLSPFHCCTTVYVCMGLLLLTLRDDI